MSFSVLYVHSISTSPVSCVRADSALETGWTYLPLSVIEPRSFNHLAVRAVPVYGPTQAKITFSDIRTQPVSLNASTMLDGIRHTGSAASLRLHVLQVVETHVA
jgi:hypothetical protein